MRMIFVIVMVISLLAGLSLSEPLTAKVLDGGIYDMEISYDATLLKVIVNSHITVADNAKHDSLSFILTSKAIIDNITSSNTGAENTLKWNRGTGDTCYVYLNSKSNSKGKNSFSIHYSLPVDTLAGGDVMLRNEERWFPRFVKIPFRFHAVVSVPKQYGVIMACDSINGSLQGNIAKSTWRSSRLVVAMPVYLVNKAGTRNYSDNSGVCPIEFTVRSCDDSTVNAIMNRCRNALGYYDKYLGILPINKLRIIEVPGFQAVQSLPGLMLMGDLFGKYFWSKGFNDWPAHETAHQWVGGCIFTQFADIDSGRIFVEESLAEYMKLLYIQGSFGADSMKAVCRGFQKQVDSLSVTYSLVPLYKIRINHRASGIQAYEQGPLVWFHVAQMVGQDKWQEFLRGLFKKYRFQPLQYSQLRNELLAKSTAATVDTLDSLIGYTDNH